MFKAQIENRLSLWCGLKWKDVLLLTDMQARHFLKLFDAPFRLSWQQIIFCINDERIVETKDNESMKGKSIVQSKD